MNPYAFYLIAVALFILGWLTVVTSSYLSYDDEETGRLIGGYTILFSIIMLVAALIHHAATLLGSP